MIRPERFSPANSNDQTSEAQSAKVRDVRENSIENVSDNLKSEEQSAAAKVVSGGEDNEGVALVTGAGIKGDGTGSSTLPASGLSSASQETAGIPVEDLEPGFEILRRKDNVCGSSATGSEHISNPGAGRSL